MLARLLRLVLAFPAAVVLHAQAAAEYALRSSGSAASSPGGDAAIGSCRVDSAVLSCLSRSYPQAAIVVLAVILLFIVRASARHSSR